MPGPKFQANGALALHVGPVHQTKFNVPFGSLGPVYAFMKAARPGRPVTGILFLLGRPAANSTQHTLFRDAQAPPGNRREDARCRIRGAGRSVGAAGPAAPPEKRRLTPTRYSAAGRARLCSLGS